MTGFELQPPSYGAHWTYKSGDITVTAREYLLGQFRLQVWCGPGQYPDILSPQC